SGSEGARVFREVAWALAYAHDQGFVHRDVKPDNILLERSTGRVLVADFGIAAALGNVSADGVSGTPEFMSPEQVLGKTLDGRTDIYGLGASAFYAFSGRFPFEGSSATEILAKHVAVAAPPLASLGLSVPRKVAALIDRCLSKEADQRPANANAVAEQLTVALEQRREIPVALRAFVKRAARIDGPGTLIISLTLLPISIGVSAGLGMLLGFGTLFAGSVVAPLAYMTGASRRLLLQGFAFRDLAPAFKSEIEQNEEEIRIDGRMGKSLRERLGLVATLTFLPVLLATGIPLIFGYPAGWRGLLQLLATISATGTFVSALIHTSGAQVTKDVDSRFWSRLWTGIAGRSAFALARRTIGANHPVPSMTHRATELSLGMAAEQLYESLPKETRKALASVPELLTRLQHDAQALRRQHDELQDAIAMSGTPDGHLVELRDSVHTKLGEAVGALETIRLDLLRLHAGSTTIQSITTHLGLAVDVSDEIGRLIAANKDVERMLHFPRLAASTPV
ncbi:MAG: serine/threonine-protein kinase, partial [Gemmatimonadaceae bacterium]